MFVDAEKCGLGKSRQPWQNPPILILTGSCTDRACQQEPGSFWSGTVFEHFSMSLAMDRGSST